MKVICLEGSRMTDRAATHKYLAEKLDLPSYYGRNLDALADVLWDLPEETCLVLVEEEAMLRQLGRYGEMLTDVLCDVSEQSGRLRLIRF